MRTTPLRFTSRRSAWPSMTNVSTAGSLTSTLRPAPGRMRTRGAVESDANGTPNEIAPTPPVASTTAVYSPSRSSPAPRTPSHTKRCVPARKLAAERARDPPALALDADAHVRRRRECERQREPILAAVAVRRERQRRNRHEAERAIHAQRDQLLDRDARAPFAP